MSAHHWLALVSLVGLVAANLIKVYLPRKYLNLRALADLLIFINLGVFFYAAFFTH